VISADTVIAQARTWVGVRFLHQGRTRSGVDCLGFIAALMAELGSTTALENLPLNYSRSPQAQLLSIISAVTREIELQAAALVVIQWPLAPFPSHAGIYTGANLIHCNAAEGRVVEHGYRGPWVKRTASVWALPMVIYE
jgi:cell wall-associated NlpC family hydrolase